jgi:hypothetical protein
MSVKVYYEILNQKGTPAFYSDTYANRPAFGFAGRVFISTDTGQIFEDTGSAWSLIADAGVGGGTLASVTANGNTTATGIVITAGGLSADSIIDTALTTGSVLFSGAGGVVSQKNSNLFWDNTNNRLGIGINSPGAPLDIHSTGTNAQFNGTGTNNAYLQFQNAGTSKWRIGNTYNAGANTFDIYNNGLATNALTIKSTTNESIFSGSVGIGSGTNPVYSLDVVGNTRVTGQLNAFASGSGYGLYVQGLSNQNAALIVGNSTTSNSYGLGIQAGTNSSDSPLTITNYAASTTFLKVLGDGSIGIGTSTPYAALQVNGNVHRQYTGAGTSGTPISEEGFVYSEKTNANALAGMWFENNFQDLSGVSVIFKSRTNGGTVTERLRISNAGNVIIGSSTDVGQKLQVSGAITSINNVISSYSSGNGSTYGFINNGAGALILTNSGVADRGSFNMTTGVYTPLSDINKKKDFEISNIGLNAILSLKPTLYRIKEEDNTEKHLGFIAQEVKQYIPQAYVESGNFIGLDYQAIVATLVKSIQELNEKLVRNNIN